MPHSQFASQHVPAEAAQPVPDRERPWAVSVVAVLLLVQAVALFAIALTRFLALELPADLDAATAVIFIYATLTNSLVYTALGLLALGASFSFYFVRPTGWFVATLTQGLILLVTLVLYSLGPDWFVYLLMLHSIFMVLYLYHPDVETTFRARQASRLEAQPS